MEKLFELKFDEKILIWIEENLRNPFLDTFMVIYTHMGDNGIIWIIMTLAFLFFKSTKRAGVLGIYSLLLMLIINNGILKPLFARPRPYIAIETLNPLLTSHDPNSFPSGHSAAAFAVGFVWLLTLPKKTMKIVVVIMAFLMGFSRMYVGVHYFTDVLGSLVVGCFCGYLSFIVEKLVNKKITSKNK